MRRPWLPLRIILPILGIASTARAQVTITDGRFAVSVNELGVLVDGPQLGLRTVDARPVTLVGRFAEWSGLSFDGASGRVEGVAPGNAIDWSGRRPVQPVSLSSRPDSAVVVTRLAELEIRTAYWFDTVGPYLIASVTLTNLGPASLANLCFSREWRQPGESGWTFPDDSPQVPQAPPEICRRLWRLGALAPGASVELGLAYQPDL